jgi:very-short-patch-repair endonuclease
VLTLGELLYCGLTEDDVRGRVARGQLHRIHRGVYAVGHPGLTAQGRWLAAVKACGPGALLCRHAAGMHYGFLPMEDRRPEVMTTVRRTVEGVRTRVLARRPPATRSELEDRLHDLIVAGGFAAPDVNVPLVIAGRRVIPDVRWPAQRLVVEADSREWHDNPQARLDDAERQALLEAVGERVVRVTWEQAAAHITQTHARLTAAGAPRSTT